jgi:hypothetical protein
MIVIVVYVDDCLTIGTEEAIKEFIIALKGHNFHLKVDSNLTDYFSCNIVQERDKRKGWIMQSYLINNQEKKFCEEVRKRQSYTTSGIRFKILRPTRELVVIETNMQSIYELDVGMFFNFIIF